MNDPIDLLRRVGLEPSDAEDLRRELSAREWRRQAALERLLGEDFPWHLRRYGWRRVPRRPGAP